MSEIMQAMALLRNTFNKYAGKDGDPESLTKAELSELLHNEFSLEGFKGSVDQFFNALDDDKDGVVDFKEYITFVTALTILCSAK